MDPEHVVIAEMVDGNEVHLMYVEVWDGLYAPIGLRKPTGKGPFPIVMLSSGNGGEGMAWIRDAVQNRGYIMDRLVEAGYACAWLRYRTEVELGYNAPSSAAGARVGSSSTGRRSNTRTRSPSSTTSRRCPMWMAIGWV